MTKMKSKKVLYFHYNFSLILKKEYRTIAMWGSPQRRGECIAEAPGVPGGQGNMNISWKSQVLKWQITLFFGSVFFS
jgi:hypothetical protein